MLRKTLNNMLEEMGHNFKLSILAGGKTMLNLNPKAQVMRGMEIIKSLKSYSLAK